MEQINWPIEKSASSVKNREQNQKEKEKGNYGGDQGGIRSLQQYLKTLLSVFLSKAPFPPGLDFEDVRSNRVKLRILPNLSSPYNLESYEVQYTVQGKEEWKSMGFLEHIYRTVAPLKPGQQYQFRCRAFNRKGLSRESDSITLRTRLIPVEGGAILEKYTWTQNPAEVIISFRVPTTTKSKDILLKLSTRMELSIYILNQGIQTKLVQGILSNKVQSMQTGSFWELMSENDGSRWLIVTLEKMEKSRSMKFDYWQSVFENDLKIDTHLFEEKTLKTQEVDLGDWVQVSKED
eukprot:TRINITY_DN140394_c0_g1_i1.p1 TRINITY_DN140394_c0_g1~~TRINITY_DN140394_c0_g1_i1.p1  ORF type:complete len:292 (+),score=28.99 TRINITY_DN140394_c0_g1_i1:178-1053(+)